MSFTYYKFIFLNTIRRKAVWITWLLYLVATVLLLIVLPAGAKMNTLQLWGNSSMPVCQTFIGITVAIFTAILSIAIFKNTRDEGTELIIISKPISRAATISSKFIVFFTICLLANISAVLLSMTAAFLPYTEHKFYWGMILSMFIGNIVSFLVFGAIACILSIKFARAGIIVGNAVIALVLLVYQILTSFVLSSTMTTLVGISDETVKNQSYILPVRNTEDGTYTEDNFVCFIPLTNDQGEYDVKAKTWQDMKDYWTAKNSKQNNTAIIATDIGNQLALSYLTVGVDGYTDRQASRMYNFSRYYDYELTKPASPEYYQQESSLKFLYVSQGSWTTVGSFNVYLPTYFVFPGLRSTKSSYLKGTVTDVIPIADIDMGSGILSRVDVTFEADEWQKYKAPFDIMYNNVFNYDVKKGDGTYYYTFNLESKAKRFSLNNVWCDTSDSAKNLTKWYKLVWACLTGHHGDSEYFGSENDPLKDYEDLDVKSVVDLNKRYLQFKDYCFYKAYDEQHKLMFEGVDDTEWDKEKTYYNTIKTSIQTVLDNNNMHIDQYGDGGERSFVVRGLKDGTYLQPYTQTMNNTLINYVMAAEYAAYNSVGWDDPDNQTKWIASALNGSYAKWIRTSTIGSQAYVNEDYLFESLDEPTRTDSIVSEQYLTGESWIPYNMNYRYDGEYPFGQNLQYSFYTCNKKVPYWQFALIWCLISAGLYVIPIVVYSKYDIK